MFDSLFTGILTLALLVSGAFAFGADVARDHRSTAPAVEVVTLPTVTIVAHRQTARTIEVAAL